MTKQTVKPRNSLSISYRKVNTVYFAKKESIDIKSSDTINYSFGSNGNNTSNAKGKKKIATIIFNKEMNSSRLNDADKRSSISEIIGVLTEDTYNKGDVIKIPLLREKVSFKKINKAGLGDEIYVISETENLKDQEIRFNIRQANEDGLENKDKSIRVQQNNEDAVMCSSIVGEFGCDSDTIENAADFKDWAIAKITLEPKDAKIKKSYLDYFSECKITKIYLVIDAENNDKGVIETIYDEVFDATPNVWLKEEGKQFLLEMKKENSEYYIYKTGKIKLIKGINDKNNYYVEKGDNQFQLIYTLSKNSDGVVKIPDSGNGFGKYGTTDAGGVSGLETVGVGDRYLLPKTAAALFGIINEVNDKGWTVDLGDMSSSNGSDPWQSGFSHHAGHGHNGNRKGKDVDFRYLNTSGKSFQGYNSSSNFDPDKNKTLFELAYKYGFKKNYCTNMNTVFGGNILGVSDVPEHIDHGHIGLSDIDLEEVDNIKATIL